MLEVDQEQDMYVLQFERLEKRLAGGDRAWLSPIRKAAIARFAELGFPTTRQEEWRYTNVAPIAHTDFEPAGADGPELSIHKISAFTFDDDNCSRLVFVNGRWAPQLSSIRPMPGGVKVCSLATALDADTRLVEPYLARHAGYQDQPFTALNTAFVEDGAFVHLPKGSVVDEPIHLLFVSTTTDHPVVTHPRILIVADAGSQATIVETYAGIGTGTYFTNAVTELVANPNAIIDHYKIEREVETAFHIGTLQVHQFRDSNVSSHVVSLGGALTRNDINAVLDGEGCDCTLNGLYMLRGTQHVDNHLRVEHVKPHCDSREFFKGVLDDRSRGIFTGRIVVHKDAQKTDAKQTNMNLLLSEEALADSKPQLEIFADDVKCTHGATIGQVDADAIFYLRSRGISEEAARSLLVYAFAGESLARVRVAPLRKRLEELIFARLPQGQLLREAV